MAQVFRRGGWQQRNLIASWNNDNETKSKETGKVTGAFLDVQIDQLLLFQKNGKDRPLSTDDPETKKLVKTEAEGNPHIESQYQPSSFGGMESHHVWYSTEQISDMKKAGQTIENQTNFGPGSASGQGPRCNQTAIAFKADLRKARYNKAGETRVVVTTPANTANAKSDLERNKMVKYNESHPMGPSDNKDFNNNSLARQDSIARLARAFQAHKETPKEAELRLNAEDDENYNGDNDMQELYNIQNEL